MTAHRATLDAAVHRLLALEAPIQGTLPAFFANTASGTHRTLLIIGSNLASGAEGCHLVIGVIDLDGATHQLAVHLPMATSALMTAGLRFAAFDAGILHVIVGVMVTTNSASPGLAADVAENRALVIRVIGGDRATLVGRTLAGFAGEFGRPPLITSHAYVAHLLLLLIPRSIDMGVVCVLGTGRQFIKHLAIKC